MFETHLNHNIRAALLITAVWGLATILASRGPVDRSPRRGRIRAIVLLTLVGLGWLVIVNRIFTTIDMGRYGLVFVVDRLVIGLPLVVVPAIAVLVWSVPPLLDQAHQPDSANRLATFTPRAVVPFYAVTIGGLIGFYTALIDVVSSPLLTPALVIYGGVAVLLTGAWFGQGRRWLSASGAGGWRRRSWPIRLVRGFAAVVVVVVAIAGAMTWAAKSSRLPADMSMTEHGGGHLGHSASAAGGTVSVADLTGPRSEVPDRRFTLVAQPATVRLTSGRVIEAWTFNGQVPGPELRMRQGELVEITVINKLVDTNVSVHWHGVDVPNAEDGVAGVTQDAIRPGETYVYRFRPDEAGTHWYHSHQQSSIQVKKGLFGPLIIEPASGGGLAEPAAQDLVVPLHTWYVGETGYPAISLADRVERRQVAAGTRVRLRLLNTDNRTHIWSLNGTSFIVTAIDGNPVNGPTELSRRNVLVGAGGRYDVEFTMPDHLVRLAEARFLDGGILFSPDGTGELAPDTAGTDLDPTRYGTPASTPFGPDSRFTREYSMMLDNELGFYNGKFTFKWTINGEVFPSVPTLTVREGDLVKVKIANRSHFDHPIHLHGHHVLVLSRNGKRVTGSPVWLDTVNVRVGEIWEVAFRADNPGIWMDHCHILDHAGLGMMLHVAYDNVTTPYRMGRATPNNPE